MRIFIFIVIYFFALSNSLKADEAIGKNFLSSTANILYP